MEVYKAMEAQAEDATRTEDGALVKLYTGFLTKEFPKLHLSNPYFSKCMRALQAMDCVRQQRRGGGGAPSEWLILQPPSRELWPRAEEDAINPTPQAVASQALRDINARLVRVEEALGIA
jgi:hypothetical protein